MRIQPSARPVTEVQFRLERNRIHTAWRPAISESTPPSIVNRRSAEDFLGTARFLVQRRLGAGAYGVVYEAYDREVDALVALKVLHHNADGEALYRFKKGFRSLADLRHDNLVTLYELLSEDGFWFFTMELITGVDLIAYLRQDYPASQGTGSSSVDRFQAGLWENDSALPDPQPHPPILDPVDPARLRTVWRQLAQGLHALHQNSKLHRDIKPSNVLVRTRDQRVVLLDFGLVAELESGLQSLHAPMGTPAYMSPEQAAGALCTPASDWYSVGIMLYEILVGDLPFHVSLAEMSQLKEAGEWFKEGLYAIDPPEDLCALVEGLLQPRPEDRLDTEAIFSLLETDPSALLHSPSPLSTEPLFIGREEASDALKQALSVSQQQAVMFYIRGSSGVGKTALVHHFLDHLEESGEDAVVLMGRCYQQESVPYKVFDSLIDALTRYLRTLSDHDVEVLLPIRIGSLTRLFPVLRRIDAVAELSGEDTERDEDPQFLRRRAAAALRQLLTRISERRTLILFIDDLQWGDEDSFSLLEQLLRPPAPPNLLLIGCFRSEDEDSSPFLRHLAEHRVALATRGIDVRDLDLQELTDQEAQHFVELAIDREGIELSQQQVKKIVREARGNPFFLSELVRGGQLLPGSSPKGGSAEEAGIETSSLWTTGEFQLRDLILSRISDLPPEAHRLLEILAIAGTPLDFDAATEAAELTIDRNHTVSILQKAKLVRLLSAEEHPKIEVYHDGIREALVEALDADHSRALHRRLALALESSGRGAPEALAIHFQATEEEEQARSYAKKAAERAEQALAFDHAARLYRMAIDLLPASSSAEDNEEHYALRVRLGDALANAGLSREAADAFLRAASDSGSINPFDAQRNAAENLLISGHIERGLQVLRHVLRGEDLKLENRPWKLMLKLWWWRVQLRSARFRFEPKDEKDCPPKLLKRIDLCWSAATGLCLVDVLQASVFHARHLHLALRAGEPSRIARGLAMEVFFGSMEGADPHLALERARDLAGRVEGLYASSLTEMAAGMQSCSKGAWEEAARRLDRAERHLSETGAGVVWELDTVRHFQILALFHLGRWKDLFDRLPSWLEDARHRGDLYFEVHLCHWVVNLQLLCRDQPKEALEITQEACERWSKNGFHYQHFGHSMAEAQTLLYSGHGRAAWREIHKEWEALDQSMLQRIEMVHVQSFDLRARCALAAAADPRTGETNRRRLLSQIKQDAHKIEKAQSPWARGLASLLKAGLAVAEDDREEALSLLHTAEEAFEISHMPIHVQVTRYRRGQLERSELGQRTMKEATSFLRREGIERPRRLCRMLAPEIGWGNEPAGDAVESMP